MDINKRLADLVIPSDPDATIHGTVFFTPESKRIIYSDTANMLIGDKSSLDDFTGIIEIRKRFKDLTRHIYRVKDGVITSEDLYGTELFPNTD